jgi:hypothetical protein
MKLFKFVPPERLDILAKEQIVFTPPERFKDPFELRPRFAVAVAQRIWDESFEEVKRNHLKTDLKGLSHRQQKKRIRALKEKEKKNLDLKPLNLVSRIEETVANHLNRTIGIFCLSSQLNDNLMWYHYADGHRGFVLEFDTEDEEFRKLGQLFEVIYKEVPRIYGAGDLPSTDVVRVKPIYLKYESEYRVVRHLKSCNPETIGRQTLHFCPLSRNCIKGIYLGHRIDPLDRTKLLGLIKGTSIFKHETRPSKEGFHLLVD